MVFKNFFFGCLVIEVLRIVEFVDEVIIVDFKVKFLNFFQGLGKLDGLDYVIKFKLDVKFF